MLTAINNRLSTNQHNSFQDKPLRLVGIHIKLHLLLIKRLHHSAEVLCQ